MYGLKYYDSWLSNGENDYFLKYYLLSKNKNNPTKTDFINIANWFVKNIQIRSYKYINFGVYEYQFDWETYNLKRPWVSGMAHGIAIQNLLRAFKITGKDKFVKTARLLMNSFLISIDNGGVAIIESETHYWFEEYAANNKEAKKSMVLNGMLHSLIAINEYNKMFNNKEFNNVFNYGMNSLKANIKKFSSGNWTYYDALNNFAKYKYHNININLTKFLYAKTGSVFLEIYKEWEVYDIPFVKREFIIQQPNYFDFTILGLMVVINFTLIYILSVVILKIKKT